MGKGRMKTMFNDYQSYLEASKSEQKEMDAFGIYINENIIDKDGEIDLNDLVRFTFAYFKGELSIHRRRKPLRSEYIQTGDIPKKDWSKK
jgi:hypothetical protein